MVRFLLGLIRSIYFLENTVNHAVHALPTEVPKLAIRSASGNFYRYLVFAAFLLGTHAMSQAAVFAEDFELPFPAWETGAFGSNSNARNYYCDFPEGCASRGNNPDGLYVSDSSDSLNIDIRFNPLFGNSLTVFSLGVAAFSQTTLSAFDSNGTQIFSEVVRLTAGALTDPGDYATYVIKSINGISSFRFNGDSKGNTSIDNLVLTTRDDDPATQVPEPATAALLGLGMLGCIASRRRSSSGQT